MRPVILFITTFFLTGVVIFPGVVRADDLDDLDVTMEIIDDVSGFDFNVAEMEGPDGASLDDGDDYLKDESGEESEQDDSGDEIEDSFDDDMDDAFEHDEDFDDEELDEEDEFEHEEGEDIDDDEYDDDDEMDDGEEAVEANFRSR